MVWIENQTRAEGRFVGESVVILIEKKETKKPVKKKVVKKTTKVVKPAPVKVSPPVKEQPVQTPARIARAERIKLVEHLNERLRRHAMRDFAIFLDEYVYIEDKEKNCAIKPEWWPAQKEILPKLVNSPLLELLKTRQVGLTWLSAALVLWLAMKNELHLSVIISASEDHAKEFLDRVYFILDRLPAWMIPPITTRTVLTLEFTRNKLKSTIKSMPTIEMGAESKTPNLLIIDEAHTIRSVDTIFNSSYPGIEQAKGRVIVIANSVKTGPGWPWVRDTYVKSMKGEGRFDRIFLAWMAHPGRPADFRERMIASGMNEQDVIEHYPANEEEALQSAFGSFFSNALSRHMNFEPGETGFLIRDSNGVQFIQDRNGMLAIWDHPDTSWKGRYAIGTDVSEGLGQDFSVAYVIDRVTSKLVARMRSNRIDAHVWGTHVHDLSEHYGFAVVCPERNGSGITTIKRMEDLGTPMYVRIVAGKTAGVVQKEYGWNSTSSSKFELCGDLKTYLSNTTADVLCGVLIEECSTFIRFENGRLGAEDGKHDDAVIAAGLTIQADKFMGAAIEIPKPVKEPSIDTLEYIAFKDRQACLEAAMDVQNEDGWEW